MKEIKLVVPPLEEYWYEQKLLSDPNTMSYNAGYEVSYDGYCYETGCIDFPKTKWVTYYEKRNSPDRFFAYIKDVTLDKYVGYANYQYNKDKDRYECGIVIEGTERGNGYSKPALNLLCEEARKNGVLALYDNFEKDRKNTLNVFESVGFEIIEENTYKKFGKPVQGIIVEKKLLKN